MLTKAQQAERATGVGGSESSAVLEVNPYKTPLDVYLDKVGEAPPFEGNDATYWGERLEDLIAREYAKRRGVKIQRRNPTLRHPEHSFLVGHIDRMVVGERRPLECKTAGAHMAADWGEPGTDQVPGYHLIQVTQYMLLLDAEVADLAVLIGGRDFRIYTIPFDRELADMIVERVGAFWYDHVMKRVPPAPTTAKDLATLYAIDNGEALVADEETEATVEAHRILTQQIKALELQKEAHALHIKTKMGPNTTLLGADGSPLATWKAPKDSMRLDAARLKADHPDLVEAYSAPVKASRRFLVK